MAIKLVGALLLMTMMQAASEIKPPVARTTQVDPPSLKLESGPSDTEAHPFTPKSIQIHLSAEGHFAPFKPRQLSLQLNATGYHTPFEPRKISVSLAASGYYAPFAAQTINVSLTARGHFRRQQLQMQANPKQTTRKRQEKQ